ncbi:MAG: hypothetical protein WCF67_09330, partial [Chitinophagaceae bacterium]
YKSICTSLQTFAIEQDKVLWIAMDNLGIDENKAPFLEKPILDFFQVFGVQMQKYLFRKHFRLMLIDYPTGRPTNWKAEHYIETQEFKEDDIIQKDIELSLAEWRLKTKKFVTDEKLNAIAAEVIAKAEAPWTEPEPALSRLERIHDALIKKIVELEGGAK